MIKDNGSERGSAPNNITSLDEARRQAKARERQRQQQNATASRTHPPVPANVHAKEWIAGLILIVMALGALVSFIAPLLGAGRRAAG